MNNKIKILLVEDLPSDAYLVQRELKKTLGAFDFMVADNREEFLECMATFNPDIILSDYSLPGFDWSAAFRLTRELSSEIPFLIVSSSVNPNIINTCLKAGVNGFISKDNLHLLASEILKLLENTGKE
jgi:CheY-like chemotaxis protein